MSDEPLRDSLGRLRITPRTDAALEARARITGESKHDIAREFLDEWADREHAIATLHVRLARREGSEGTPEGQP